MTVRVHYLNWDECERGDRADVLHHEVSAEESVPTEEDLDECYRELDVDLEAEGAGDAESLNIIFDRLNRTPTGYSDQLDDLEERSMSSGDVIELDGTAYMCAPFGWEEVGGGDA